MTDLRPTARHLRLAGSPAQETRSRHCVSGARTAGHMQRRLGTAALPTLYAACSIACVLRLAASRMRQRKGRPRRCAIADDSATRDHGTPNANVIPPASSAPIIAHRARSQRTVVTDLHRR